MRKLNLVGRKFGYLTVLSFHSISADGRSMWLCRCDCGAEKVLRSNNLILSTRSCGCVNRGATTHGGRHRPEYQSWRAMKKRCLCPTDRAFKNYGGRGIKVCERWRISFPNFLEDMGPRPTGFTIERSNNDGDYEPGNCVWATRAQQNRNKRR